jgi:hypothetical protein
VLEAAETLRRRLFRGECDRQNLRWVAVLSPAVKGEARSFPEGTQNGLSSGTSFVATAAQTKRGPQWRSP